MENITKMILTGSFLPLCLKIFLHPVQCLGYGSGSVGSARFWLPGSGSAKICGSTDPDPRGKISIKNWKKKNFTPET